MSDEREPALTIGAVARRLGLAVPTLRSWDRRYGLGPSTHERGKHRRYTRGDLARLRRMSELTSEGVPPASAARIAQGAPAGGEPQRDGGGTGAVGVGRVERGVRGLARTARRLDVSGVRYQVENHLGQRGVARTWDDLLVPLLRSIAGSYEAGEEGAIAVEHVATAGILGAFHARGPVPESRRLPALLSCAPEEQHTMPLEALHASLAEHAVASRFLGARVPSATIASAAERIRPRIVAVWAQTPSTARKVRAGPIAASGAELVLCGPGWSSTRVAREHVRPTSLQEAIESVLQRVPDAHGTGHA